MAPTPTHIPDISECISPAPPWNFGTRHSPADLNIRGNPKPLAQRGGRTQGITVLNSFLHDRGVNYRADMASPITGFDGCSRLSAHLAFGTVSIRETHHALRARQAELKSLPAAQRDKRWLQSMSSFQSRLRWHCHFMQKLESEPDIEFHNMNRAYDGIRTEDPADWTDEERTRYRAWCAGRTGYPFVDACMRCLHHTGWMNFRMRSMLVSFASYHLWLHWRPTAIYLARHFLDFEPGIHYSQFQMQSGVTGINTVRIYNPIKQSQEQDPDGVFIKRWVPELADVPTRHIHEPWKHLSNEASPLFADQTATTDHAYPPPIVDHGAAYKFAKDRIFAVRKTAAARANAKKVYLKHGSRRRPTDPPYRGGPEDRNGAA
ncbi:MAG: FAD-binding domain-containing protein [Planctomycetota bacterium]